MDSGTFEGFRSVLSSECPHYCEEFLDLLVLDCYFLCLFQEKLLQLSVFSMGVC